jgi:hypothetical protein
MFCVETLLFALCILALPELSTLAYIFQFDTHARFRKAFKPKSTRVSKGPCGALIGFVPISSGGIGFVFVETNVLTKYLGNWALVALVIIFNFLLNSCPFLLG